LDRGNLIADLSSPGASVLYGLVAPIPRAEPYFIFTFLDDDGSGAKGGPSEGDLRSAFYEVLVESEEPIIVDLILTASGPLGGP
jgi:hypothetical protein